MQILRLAVLLAHPTHVPVLAKNMAVQGGEDRNRENLPRALPIQKVQRGQVRVIGHLNLCGSPCGRHHGQRFLYPPPPSLPAALAEVRHCHRLRPLPAVAVRSHHRRQSTAAAVISSRRHRRLRLPRLPRSTIVVDLGQCPLLSATPAAASRARCRRQTILRLIERLEELHTEVQGMISSPHIAMTLLFDVSRLWSQYLNRCVAASALEVEEAPGTSVPFSFEPILVELEGDATSAQFSLPHWPTLSQEGGQQAGVPQRAEAAATAMEATAKAAAAWTVPAVVGHSRRRQPRPLPSSNDFTPH